MYSVAVLFSFICLPVTAAAAAAVYQILMAATNICHWAQYNFNNRHFTCSPSKCSVPRCSGQEYASLGNGELVVNFGINFDRICLWNIIVSIVVNLTEYYVAWLNKMVPIIRRNVFSYITVNCRIFLQNRHKEVPNKSERTEIESDIRAYVVVLFYSARDWVSWVQFQNL